MVIAGRMPTTRHASTRSSIGKRIQRGGSCGVRGSPAAAGPEEYAVDEAQRVRDAEHAPQHGDEAQRNVERLHRALHGQRFGEEHLLGEKAVESGTPAIAAAATIASVAVTGMKR